MESLRRQWRNVYRAARMAWRLLWIMLDVARVALHK